MVEAGTEGVPVGADIGTIVHSEEDIALYQQAQETRGMQLACRLLCLNPRAKQADLFQADLH